MNDVCVVSMTMKKGKTLGLAGRREGKGDSQRNSALTLCSGGFAILTIGTVKFLRTAGTSFLEKADAEIFSYFDLLPLNPAQKRAVVAPWTPPHLAICLRCLASSSLLATPARVRIPALVAPHPE